MSFQAVDHLGSVHIENVTPVAVLIAARDIALERWNDPLPNGAGTMCAVNCILAVRPTKEPWRAKVYQVFASVNGILPGKSKENPPSLIAKWNDAPERTRVDVVRAFTKAIQHVQKNGPHMFSHPTSGGASHRHQSFGMPGMGINPWA